MGTVIVLLLCVVVFRALASRPAGPRVPGSAPEVLRFWWTEVLDGARTLARLDAARRARLDRPPWAA